MVPSSSTAIVSLLGPVYWIMAKGRFTGLGQGAGLTEGPVYRIIAKGRFTRRAGLPDYPCMARIGTGGRFTKGAGLTAWAGLQEKGRFRAGLSINHPAMDGISKKVGITRSE